uniref:Uncharacterized protein n=1 Tax=viral metagenome TaxID=1070528 RepID=A0A6C0FD61_9ZZZZ|tara:strand:- start:1127 stop:1450 length:324 start_codon:yes stop_codon:yes gene_type:complete
MDDPLVYDSLDYNNKTWKDKVKKYVYLAFPVSIVMIMFGLLASTYHSVSDMHSLYEVMKVQHDKIMLEENENMNLLHEINDKVTNLNVALVGFCQTHPEYEEYCKVI